MLRPFLPHILCLALWDGSLLLKQSCHHTCVTSSAGGTICISDPESQDLTPVSDPPRVCRSCVSCDSWQIVFLGMETV